MGKTKPQELKGKFMLLFYRKMYKLTFWCCNESTDSKCKDKPLHFKCIYLLQGRKKKLLKTEFVYVVLFLEITPVKQFVNKNVGNGKTC